VFCVSCVCYDIQIKLISKVPILYRYINAIFDIGPPLLSTVRTTVAAHNLIAAVCCTWCSKKLIMITFVDFHR